MSATVHNTLPNRNQKWAWMWIAYTGFLFIDPLMEPSTRLWALTLTVFAVFVVIFALYVRANNANNNLARFSLIGATFAIGLVTFPWNPGASCLFVYAASVSSVLYRVDAYRPFAVRRGSRGHHRRTLLIPRERSFCRRQTGPTHGLPSSLWSLSAAATSSSPPRSVQTASCKWRRKKSKRSPQSTERERIARDLHDVLGHTLSVIVLKAELAKRLIATDPNRATTEIADVETIGRSALAEVREAIGGYRARGLAAEIEAARRTLESAGVALLTDASPSNIARPFCR